MSVSIVTDPRVGLYGVRITAYQVVFTFFRTPTPALAPTRPPCSVGNVSCITGGKVVGAWGLPLASI